MTSKTEDALAQIVTLLAAKASDEKTLPPPVRNEALPSRLAELETAAKVTSWLCVWDGDTEIQGELLGADEIENGFDLEHVAQIEFVVAGGASNVREKAFDDGVAAIDAVIRADRTLGGRVDTSRITRVGSNQRDLVTEGMTNAKGATIDVRLTFTSSSIR